jgi:hypothetical protein
MTTQAENQDTVQTSAFDPFPQPQTIPSGWDTSGLISDFQLDSANEAADSAESASRWSCRSREVHTRSSDN